MLKDLGSDRIYILLKIYFLLCFAMGVSVKLKIVLLREHIPDSETALGHCFQCHGELKA